MPEHILSFLVSAVDDSQKVSLCLLDGVSYPLSLGIVLPRPIYSASVGFFFFFFQPLIRKETIDFRLLIDNLCRLPLAYAHDSLWRQISSLYLHLICTSQRSVVVCVFLN